MIKTKKMKNHLTASVHTAQVCVSGCIPESNTSISCATSRCKKPMQMGGPCYCFYSSSMLTVFQDRLSGVLIPNEKLYMDESFAFQSVEKLNVYKASNKLDRQKNFYYILCCHFHLMLVHGYHKTTSVHKPTQWPKNSD